MKIAHTRAMVNAALNGDLENVSYEIDPIFGLEIPQSCPNVPEEVLNPKNTWEDKAAYDEQAKKLAAMFNENFKQFEDQVSDEVKKTAPKA
jgi:phosphoenolpyruvate carboxykinase (ATP)